ncbi:MAG: flagellar biosynthesis protein FlhB [Bacteroidota bacterium]
MAEGQEKTFDPTAQRIRKAREDGNVFRSQEILSVGMLTTGLIMLWVTGTGIFEEMRLMSARLFLGASTTQLNMGAVPPLLYEVSYSVLMMLLPLFAAFLVVGIAGNISQTGFNFTTKVLEPKPDRISPLKGLKRIFSSKGVFGVVKSLSKIVIVGPIAYFNISSRMDQIMMLHTIPLQDALALAGPWLASLLIQVVLVLAALAIADFAFEKWKYNEDLKMSKQEIQDEQKQNEGDAQIKGKRRQIAMEMARRPRLDHAVLKADVVVTNPTHYAIALYYNPEESPAPRVLVKGIRKRALRIKQLALDNGIPTIENRPLARALYATVEEQQEIPEELYQAVAAILIEIYQTEGRQPGQPRA